jgi:TonB family protein
MELVEEREHPTMLLQRDDGEFRLLLPDVEVPWFRSLYGNLKELLRPPKLPVLEVTSRPVPVPDIWGQYSPQKKCWGMSLSFQIILVLLLFSGFSRPIVQQKVAAVKLIAPDISPYVPEMTRKQRKVTGGGGGGARSPLPASKGRLPTPSLRQFTTPVAVVNNPNPKLAMDPSLIVPPEVPLPEVNLSNYGDPLAKLGPLSNGPGSGGGIGSGSGGGVGSGRGGGFGPGEGGGTGGGVYGGVGGGVFHIGGGVSAPVLLYKVEPEYSEEARQARYQGTVVIYVEVDPKGRVANYHVVRALGLGLDEKALEAIQKWKFRPGYKDGKPVTVAAIVEVNFRLL